MARAAEPAAATNEIVFELERFERSGTRLTLSGRWFGVRGRRFVRPTLTLDVEGEHFRALADLDDKPWPAEDGEPWRASFPWAKDGPAAEPELSVAPDITIQLPSPSARRSRPQRLAAQPRRAVMDASWGGIGAAVEAEGLEDEPEPDAVGVVAAVDLAESPAPPVPEPDPDALRAEIDELRVRLADAETAAAVTGTELEALRQELSAALADLEQARRELGGRGDEHERFQAELAATRAAREAALRSAARAEAEREDALARAAKAESAREALVAEQAVLNASLVESRGTVEQLTRQHNEAMATRGAALVMRGATQALPAYERHVGWFRRGIAVVVLIAIVFAVLIVLGAL